MVETEGAVPTDPLPGQTPTPRPPSAYRSVLRLPAFRRLWLGLSISSLGDWIGLFALLSMTDRLSGGNTLAVGGLMIFRVLPAFIVGPLAGVALDRIDRRKAMVVSDVLRACLIAIVPFAQTLPALYAVSFLLETISLVWMPAKDSLIPNIVPGRWLVAANSLSLFSTYGVFPLGALTFTGLVAVAGFLGTHVAFLEALSLNQENLALWLDACTFLLAAFIVSRIRFPALPRQRREIRLRVLWDEVVEGLRYFRAKGEIARIMRGFAVALSGGAVIFSLGAPYNSQVLGAGPSGFGFIVAALGTGMGLGVLVLGFVGDRLPKAWTSSAAVIAGGLILVAAALANTLPLAIVVAGLLGASGGVAYATAFALLQERVDDNVRGRTFASVQIVIRTSLFVSLVAFPALAGLFATEAFLGSQADGIRLAFAAGGLVTCAAGLLGALDVYRGRVT